MRAVLVDDEKHALENLKQALDEKCPEVLILGLFQNPKKAVEFVKSNPVELVFLDVDMPEMDGFSFIKQFDDQQFEVIFTTAFDKYAVQAFRVSAVDYLLKPIDLDLIEEAVSKARTRLRKGISKELYSFFKKQLEESNTEAPQRIAISSSDSINFITLNDIVYCQGESNYSRIIMMDGSNLLVTRTLKELETILSSKSFFRVHKSYIVNCDRITSYLKADGGYLLMDNDDHIPVARLRKNELLQRITEGN